MGIKKFLYRIYSRIKSLTSISGFVNVFIIKLLERVRSLSIYSLNKKQTRSNLKLQKKIETIQQQMINKQLNAHFTLKTEERGSTKVLNEEPVEAYDLVNSFSNLMRSGVLFSDGINWSLETELSFTRNYLDLMKIRYNTLFDFEMHIGNVAECKNHLVPRLLVQNCTENAIKRAFASETAKSHMRIIGLQSGEAIEITISINLAAKTKFENKTTNLHPEHSCMLLNLKQIEAYNKRFQTDITLDTAEIICEAGLAQMQIKLLIPTTH